MKQMPSRARRLSAALLMLLCLAGWGCTPLSFLVATVAPEIPTPAAYAGLKGQTVAIVVWADRSARMDFPNLQGDIASSLKNQLTAAKLRELEGTHFLDPTVVARYMANHPETDVMHIQDIAPKLGATRIIQIEMHTFQIHTPQSINILQGVAAATVRVLEVGAPKTPGVDGQAIISFEQNNVMSRYPDNKPDGVQDADPSQFYQGTVRQFASEVALLFVTHTEEHQ